VSVSVVDSKRDLSVVINSRLMMSDTYIRVFCIVHINSIVTMHYRVTVFAQMMPVPSLSHELNELTFCSETGVFRWRVQSSHYIVTA